MAGRGTRVSAGMGMVLERTVSGETEDWDVWIEFTATMVSPGFAGDRWDPPHGPEWELEIDGISLDLGLGQTPAPGEELTGDERELVAEWFETHYDRACELAEEAAADRC